MQRSPLCAIVLAVGFLVPSLGAQDKLSAVFPGEQWSEKTPAEFGLNAARLQAARDYAVQTGGSGMIVRGGHAVLRWGDQQQRYDLKSTNKSIGSMLVGVAVLDGKLKLDDPAIKHHPA